MSLAINRGLAVLYYVAVALLATHEMDAVAKAEWRLLPVLSSMDDTDGLFWFVILHIPLFTLVFWLGDHPIERIQQVFRQALCGLIVIHAAAHFLLSGHPNYLFEAPLETLTVYGGGAVSLAYFALFWAARSRRRPSNSKE